MHDLLEAALGMLLNQLTLVITGAGIQKQLIKTWNYLSGTSRQKIPSY